MLPNNKILGPKYGADFPKISAALAKLDPNQVAALANDGSTVPVQIGDDEIPLEANEILVQTVAAEGLATVDSKLLTVAIDTEITEELREEGLAREMVRRIQDFRKQADFDISDRINLVYQVTPALQSAITKHREYIMQETLTLKMEEGDPAKSTFSGTVQFEGEEATIGLDIAK